MNFADYDQHLPAIIALAARVADDLDHVAATAAADVIRKQPQYIDVSETIPARRDYISWFTYADAWTDEDQTLAANAAKWLRTELPRLAETLIGTEGIDDEDDDEYDRFREYVPLWVQGVLNQPFVIDAPEAMTFWRPEDINLLKWCESTKTSASLLFAAWQEFVTRYEASKMLGPLLTAEDRLSRPAYNRDLGTDDLPEAQRVALANVANAMVHRAEVKSELLRADFSINDQVCAAIDAEVPVQRIAKMMGVTRARVYQIRDGRR